jgi:hypothetical protein
LKGYLEPTAISHDYLAPTAVEDAKRHQWRVGVKHIFEWFYVYGAVAPTTGERFFLELPYLNAERFQICVDAFAQAFADSLNILLLDNSGAHTAQRLTIPANVRLVFYHPPVQS